MNRRITAITAVAAAAVLVTAAGCNKSGDSGGSSGKTLIVGVDLPFQGSSADTSNATYNMMDQYLKSINNKAGKYTVKLQKYDDSTAAAGKWDAATCKANADAHVKNADEVAVMGTYNSGCAQIQIPILNQDTTGPMLMVSHANTNPGLTKPWSVNEPNKWYPAGGRNYARVITTDDYQGTAAARFAAQDLQVKKCFVLDDNEAYGQGVARAFKTEAAKVGITILGTQAWDGKATNYTSLFEGIKAMGPDCIYLGGIYDLNGGQLVKDKVKVLGDNNTVKLIGPDGFTGYPDFQKLAEAEGTYLTFAGKDQSSLIAAGGKAAAITAAYKAAVGSDPPSSYCLYGVQALQVILKAIEGSDGTRKGVQQQVFSGAGISLSAAESILGKDLKIDPKTGDVDVIDITVLKMTSGEEKLVKPFPVS